MSDNEKSLAGETSSHGRQRRHFAAGQGVVIVKRCLVDQVSARLA